MANYKKVDADQLDADLTAVADAIRAQTGGMDKLEFPDAMAAAIGEIYEAGQKAEYDAFWESAAPGGIAGYAGGAWNLETFRPKTDIAFSGLWNYTFYANEVAGDLVEICDDLGINFDTSNATQMISTFQYAKFTRLGVIDASLDGIALYSTFNGMSNLTTIDKLIFSKSNGPLFSATFASSRALENLTIEGTIGRDGFDVQWSTKLSKASITSIVEALSTATSGLTVTLSLTAVNNAFETAAGAADGSASEEWLALAATKSNWTISLV